MSNNDPVKGLIAICEHLASKGMMSQEEFDIFVERMQGKPMREKTDTVIPEKQSLLYNIKKKLGWD